jgi:amidohydrolase
MLDTKTIQEAVEGLKEQLIAERRMLHENPEPSGAEVQTAAFIAGEMKKLGMEPTWLKEKVGAVYVLDTGRPGKTLALRADIDALSMPEDENNLVGKKVSVSKVSGVCHACGHDGHAAMLLAAARILAANKDELNGRIIFVFESSEEMPGTSTSSLIKQYLIDQKIDGIWGIHLYAMMDVGTVSVQGGPRMSGAGSFEIRIVGRGGHGSRPDQSINPVVTAAEIISKFQTIVPLQIAPDEAGVVTVSCIQGGDTWNIIPDTCTIRGGIRYFSVENYEKIVGKMRAITDALCAANDCTPEYVSMPKSMFPVSNDYELAKLAAAAVEKVCPGTVKEEPAWMASESFGVYQTVAPGVLAFVGIRNKELGSGAPHHNVKFDMDENALAIGAAATVQVASDFLG